MDVLVFAVALWEGHRLGMGNPWICVLCALPLFLFFCHPKVNVSEGRGVR